MPERSTIAPSRVARRGPGTATATPCTAYDLQPPTAVQLPYCTYNTYSYVRGCGRTCVRILQTLGACKTVPPKRDSVHASLRTARPVPRGPALLAAPPTSPPSEACRRGACLALWRPSRACSCKARAATALSFFLFFLGGDVVNSYLSRGVSNARRDRDRDRGALSKHTHVGARGALAARLPWSDIGCSVFGVRTPTQLEGTPYQRRSGSAELSKTHTCDLHLESAHNFIYDLSLGHELKLQSGVCKRQFVDRTARQTGN